MLFAVTWWISDPGLFFTQFQSKDHIMTSNNALKFIIFDMLTVFSSSVLSQLYPSSPIVSTFSGESASHHLWVWASLFYFLFILFFFCVFCFTMLWQRHCNQHCLSWHKLGPNAFWSLRWRSCCSDWGKKTIFNNCKFCRSPRSASTWAHSFGGAAQEITLFFIVTIKSIGEETEIQLVNNQKVLSRQRLLLEMLSK